jgi:SulP family sulfate permease
VSLAYGLLSPALWNWSGVTVGLITIVVMVVAPRLTQKVPGAILGLLAGIAAYFALAFFNRDLLQLDGNSLVIGPIEASGSIVAAISANASSLLRVQPADIGMIFTSALTLSVLLSIDTLKTGVVLDALALRRSDSNRELIGQGAANVAAFFRRRHAWRRDDGSDHGQFYQRRAHALVGV